MINLEELLISTLKEQSIKNKAPDKMPLNPSAQGFSGQTVRRNFAKFVIDEEDSVLSELKDKLALIKSLFESILVDPNNLLVQMVNEISLDLDDLYTRTGFGLYDEVTTIEQDDIFIINRNGLIKSVKREPQNITKEQYDSIIASINALYAVSFEGSSNVYIGDEEPLNLPVDLWFKTNPTDE
jgi:hypothetical protein